MNSEQDNYKETKSKTNRGRWKEINDKYSKLCENAGNPVSYYKSRTYRTFQKRPSQKIINSLTKDFAIDVLSHASHDLEGVPMPEMLHYRYFLCCVDNSYAYMHRVKKIIRDTFEDPKPIIGSSVHWNCMILFEENTRSIAIYEW